MTDHLEELGTILLTNTVRNEHFRIAGIVLEDHVTLDQFVQSLMAIDHVVYVAVTASDGRILNQQSKLTRRPAQGSPRVPAQPIYPDDRISKSLLAAPLTAPLMTRLVRSAEQTLMPHDESSDWLLPFLVLSFWNRPRSFILIFPEWTAGMNEENLQFVPDFSI